MPLALNQTPFIHKIVAKAFLHIWFFRLLVFFLPHSAVAIPCPQKSVTSGRLASVAYSGTGGGTVNFTAYDNNGNLLSLEENGTNGTAGITRTYDGLNRVTSYTEAGQTIGYRYYPSGKLAKLIYPGGTENGVGHVEYTYDADGRLEQVIDKLDSTATPRITTYTWNADGRLASVARPNGSVRSITYDAAGRLAQIADAGLSWARIL